MEENSAAEKNSKRPIRKREFAFLLRELDFWKNTSLVSEQQAQTLRNLYEPTKGHISQVLVALGAMLVGLGILSGIAANWMEFARVFRVGLILLAYIASILSAWHLEPSYPRTSRAMLLLGSFLYGGGIFLIAQMFSEGGHYTTALFWWMAGIVPAAVIFKDRLQLLMLQAIAVVYLNGLYQPWELLFGYYYKYDVVQPGLFAFLIDIIRWSEPLLLLIALWAVWWRVDKNWRVGFRINTFIMLNFLVIQAFRFFHDFTAVMLFCVVLGILIGVFSSGRWKWDLGSWGVLMTGVAGLFLTIPDIWHYSRLRELFRWLGLPASPSAVVCSVVMAVFLCVVLLWFIRREFTIAIPLFCLLILRYYFDTFYDFMPKALFFSVGGAALIGMGFWLERVRRQKKLRQQRARQNEEVRS